MIIVWMIVYNEEKNIKKTIDSVLDQTFGDFVFVISNNHSTDKTKDILKEAQLSDCRIVLTSPPEHMSALDHLKYLIYEYLNKQDRFDFSIFIGGHDVWSNNLLEVLYLRAKSENNPSIIYSDSCEINDNGQIVRRFGNVLQSSDIYKPFLPMHFLLGLTHNMIFGGLWNEQHRKSVRVRGACCGHDHLIIAEMALLGKICHQTGAMVFLGQSPGHKDGIQGYVKKHLPVHLQDKPLADFANQLDWASSIIDKTIASFPTNNSKYLHDLLKGAFMTAYIVRSYPMLNGFEEGIQKFFSNEDIRKSSKFQIESLKNLEKFILANKVED